MFQAACAKARHFTSPVIISRRSVKGECTAGIGTFVIVNKDGWIVTAAHILQLLAKMAVEERNTHDLQARIAAVEADGSLNNKERRRKLAQIGQLDDDAVDRWSVWWGQDGARIEAGTDIAIEPVDIAAARLTSINLDHVAEYPIFKKDWKDFEQGASLCRIGFPFWDVKPEWNPATESFNLTQNVPLPLFANEGVLARIAQTILVDQQGNLLPPPSFPLKSIETSNAGLLGQSGGPIFDRNGIVWGIQTSTVSYELDLNTQEQQYYNVGVGCHAETVIGLLNHHNVHCQTG